MVGGASLSGGVANQTATFLEVHINYTKIVRNPYSETLPSTRRCVAEMLDWLFRALDKI